MRAVLPLVLACSVVACGKTKADAFPSLDAWQGTARLEVRVDGKTSFMTVAKQGDVFRFEAPENSELFGTYGGAAGPRRYLLDAKARTLTLVVDGTEQALDYDLTALEALAQQPPPEPTFELRDAGRQSTVAGHVCRVYVGSDAVQSVEACLVDQSAGALTLGLGFVPPDAGWARLLLDGRHVPLAVTVKRDDAVRFAATVTAFDERPPGGPFAVPATYQRHGFVEALRRMKSKQP
jgi:hypothetical protein